jgi:hypothetical protein
MLPPVGLHASLRPVAAGLLAVAAVFAVAGQSAAASYPSSVVAKCRGDYKRLCPQYKTVGDSLDSCMRSQHRSISNSCMNALVDSGLAPAAARRR